jgi:hypothetical protein
MASGGAADNWKWWYFVVAGLLIGAYGVYEMTSSQVSKGVGSEILAVLCIAIGLFSWKAESAKSRDKQQ